MLRALTAILLLATAICLLSQVFPQPTVSGKSTVEAVVADGHRHTRDGYVGDDACTSCHRDKALSFQRTSHHLSSQAAASDTILGSFLPGRNVLRISQHEDIDPEPSVSFKMDARSDGFYQLAIIKNAVLHNERSERMDIVIGSGIRGQTYLFWSGSLLYELPVSYWTEGKQWINSPGYKDGTADFGRPVNSRCLECHATYIQSMSDDLQSNFFDRDSLVLGISCESCHGPGATHVTIEKSAAKGAGEPSVSAILNPAKISRDRQIDQCGLCHDGTQSQAVVPAFSYQPGRPLDAYLTSDMNASANQPDVHGNQVSLLKKSRCYLSSSTMSCATCHDVHQPETALASYSERCESCHRPKACGMFRSLGDKIQHKCIDCHMPLQQTNAIVSETAGRILRTSIRTHWIKVYRQKMLTVVSH